MTVAAIQTSLPGSVEDRQKENISVFFPIESDTSSHSNDDFSESEKVAKAYHRALFSIEEGLASVINQIKSEQKQALYVRKIFHLTLVDFWQEAKKNPLAAVAKISLLLVTLGIAHPSIVGTIACMNGYRLENWNDLYSSDPNIAAVATQLFSNLGQGVSFIILQGRTVFVVSGMLFYNSYRSVKHRSLLNIFNKQIESKMLSKEENEFIEKMKREEIYKCRHLSCVDDLEDHRDDPVIKKIRSQIAQEMKSQISSKHIFYLTVSGFLKSTTKHPWITMGKIALFGIGACALHPLLLGTIACLDAYRVENVSDLYSSNLTVANNATQTYSNTGHVMEYLTTSVAIMAFGYKSLFQQCVRKAKRKIINDIFDKFIRDPSLSIDESDMLYEMKQREIHSV